MIGLDEKLQVHNNRNNKKFLAERGQNSQQLLAFGIHALF
jgi:hypothetical protein